MDHDEQEAGDEAPGMRGDDELDGESEEIVMCALHGTKWPLISSGKERIKNKAMTL